MEETTLDVRERRRQNVPMSAPVGLAFYGVEDPLKFSAYFLFFSYGLLQKKEMRKLEKLYHFTSINHFDIPRINKYGLHELLLILS